MYAKGCRSICFSENFEPLGLPTIHTGHWDPVLRTANELKMVLSIHIGSSSTFHRISKDSPFMANFSLGMIRPMGCLMDWIFSGLFQRSPTSRSPCRRDRSGGSRGSSSGPSRCRRPSATGWRRARPSATWARCSTTTPQIDTEKIDVYRDYREHFYGCFIDDATGLGMLDVVGEDNVMIEMRLPALGHDVAPLAQAGPRATGRGRAVPGGAVQDPAGQRREALPVQGVGTPQGDPALALTRPVTRPSKQVLVPRRNLTVLLPPASPRRAASPIPPLPSP